MSRNAVIVLAEGFEEVEAITPVDLLRRAGIEVTMLGLNSLDVTGAHGIHVRADALFGPLKDAYDALILPGGQPGTTNLASSEPLAREIRGMHDRGRLCAAICAAPSVFARVGILAERAATCYPGVERQLNGAIHSDSPVVVDGNIITSRSAGTAIAFSLEIVKYLLSDAAARTVAAAIVYAQ